MTFLAFLAALTIFGVAGNVGVGPGRSVYVMQGSNIVAFNITNELSQTTVNVPNGAYDVEIIMPRTNPFLVWVCQRSVTVDEPQEYLVIDCVLRWRLQLPFLQVS